MTLQQLYDWAKKEGKENYALYYGGDETLPFILDLEPEYAADNSISLMVDPRDSSPNGDYYGKIFDGEKIHYVNGNVEVPEEKYWKNVSEEE